MTAEKPHIKVCLHEDCRKHGSAAILATLSKTLGDDALVEGTPDCFRFCKLGANVAVNGTVLHHLHPDTAVARVRRESAGPRAKKDVVGTRPIDELDAVLDELSRL
jgi:NADH:ubiquinone oxidoreductase subunit E